MSSHFRKILTIALLSLPMSAGIALVPVLSDLADVYPAHGEQIQLLLTLPPLFTIFSSLLTNRLSKALSLKALAQVSILMIIFAGLSPFFISGFSYLLFTRALMGIGLGLLHTLSMSLPLLYFSDEQQRNNAVGIHAAFECAGGVVFNLLSGTLSGIHWNYVYLVHLLSLVPLLAAIFIMPSATRHPAATQNAPREKLALGALPVVVVAFITVTLTCTYPLNLSLFTQQRGLGTAQFVGVLASINSLIGFAAGFVFGKVYSAAKSFTLPLGLCAVTTALLTVSFAQNQTVFLLGSVLFGIGSSFVSPSFYSMLYTRVRPEQVVTGAAMVGAAANISQFLSPFVINPIAKSIDAARPESTRLLVAAVGLLALSLIMFVFYGAQARKKK